MTTKKGQENTVESVVNKGFERDLAALSASQKKSYNTCLKSFKGLKHGEAQRVLWLLGDGISQSAILQ